MSTQRAPGAAVLGFGAALDREVGWDADVLTARAARLGLGPADLAAVRDRPLRTERDLVASVLGHLADGSGGEHHVEDPAVLAGFAAGLPGVDSLGGTCVRAAAAMDLLGLGATVHLAFDTPEVRALLTPGTEVLVADGWDEFHPHVIVQFPRGAQVRTDLLDVTAPRENRLIYVNDPANERIRLSPGLGDAVATASVVLVSGLNAVRDPALLEDRLTDVTDALSRRRPGSLAFYEDAGYHVPGAARGVRARLAPFVDVVSLNDEELAAVAGAVLDLEDPEAVHAAVSDLARSLGVRTLVVHSGRWALAHGEVDEVVRDGLRTGVSLATSRYLHGAAATRRTAEKVLGHAVPDGLGRFAARLTTLGAGRTVVVPVPPVEPATPTTIGLGDTFVGGFLAAALGSPVRG